MSWDQIPTIKPHELVNDPKRLILLTGPMRTGKTTMQMYLTDWFLRKNPTGLVFSLQLKSVEEEFRKLMPEEYRERWITSPNLNDNRFWFDEKQKITKNIHEWLKLPKLFIGDELARFADRYSNVNENTRVFGSMLGLLGHKNMSGVVADQGNDFPVATKEKSTLWAFTGTTDFVGKKLQKSSGGRLQRWLDWNSSRLIELGEFNHRNIKTKGWGIALITNGGAKNYKFFFERPEWYTYEFSTILKYVKPSDVLAQDSMNEQKLLNIKGKRLTCLLFAYHLLKDSGGKPTSEKLSNFYSMSSPVFYDSYDALPDDGRNWLGKAVFLCKTKDCSFCMDPELYKEKLAALKDFRAFKKPVISKDLQLEISQLIKEVVPV